ncbi:hypothetical protein EJ05DRAFT_531639 [Pseudovirgaria hyperparasitica]|uniref:BTB domain-containing protein n=1 Tax=Pseudovirgaria hyperparasitica TaxID=470096 RepID=A0A6A6W6T4_9PEZI|nr:uncharacterized protein EJ05DRAFT_531639 [Pseudovirgaria hyperparasitica]KAF2758572.1 hypothetical protein EJ05DRAFT_531639 [Pseudovirgaria hyperparasitica]
MDRPPTSISPYPASSATTAPHPQALLASPSSASAQPNTSNLMSISPSRARKSSDDTYRPKIITTVGAKPACLVNASVTYVGNDQIYAFGGFDQYTDEVYNHVLRLNLVTRQWNLVDNYGDIPGVRMGHTTTLWKGDKLLVFGGENEHRSYLFDVIIFNLKTATWQQPELNGPAPKGRARHSAVIYDDKLFITGGMAGEETSHVLDDICYLDLKTWTWSKSYRFVSRYDHSSWIYNGRIWVYGGIGEDMERTSEIWWLDLEGTPAYEGPLSYGTGNRWMLSPRAQRHRFSQGLLQSASSTTGYAANSSSVQTSAAQVPSRNSTVAPGTISSLRFVSSPHLPAQNVGTHFHVFSSGSLLDFATPASFVSSYETSLSSLDLDTMRWQKLADGKDLFSPNYRWQYCTMNEDGTQAWLLGCPTDANTTVEGAGEYLSDVLSVDLRKLGLLGNNLTMESRLDNPRMSISSDSNIRSHLSGIGADFARAFDQPPENGSSGADFVVTAERDDDFADDITMDGDAHNIVVANPSKPIHVHRLILTTRWPHFARLYASGMLEYQNKKLHLPEPYSAVRSFLYYLYTDSIATPPPTPANPQPSPTLADVAGMLVMSNIYDMPRLRLLCVNRLGKELDVEHAAIIWERAGTANEEWLRQRAATFCMLHWGRVVRTEGFRTLGRKSLMELCEETADAEGRVVGGDELEAVGGFGARFGSEGGHSRKRSSVAGALTGDEADGEEDGEDEGMDVN